jgi:PAS domain S-box-containing protein
MGKRSHIIIMLVLGASLMVIYCAWYIGLQQAYNQQKEALKSFVDAIQSSANQLDHQQQIELAQQNNIQLYHIFRNKGELISISPNTGNLNKSLILQALKQTNGLIQKNGTDFIFYKYQIDEKTTHIASLSLEKIRVQYIKNTQYKTLMLTLIITVFFMTLLAWQYCNKYQQKQKRLNQDKNKTHTGIYLKLDHSFSIIEYNDSFKEIFPHAQGQRLSYIVKADEQEKIDQYLSQVISSKSNIDFECTLIQQPTENSPDIDESRWAIRAKYFSRDGTIFIIISADDISKRYHMEVELRHERNRMRTYLNTMHTLLVISDRQGRIIEANQQFIKLIGSDEKKILDKPISNFFPKRCHHQIYNHLRNISPNTNTTISAEFPLIAQTGKEYSIDWRITSVPSDNESDNDNCEILLTGLDITESVANNQALKFANIQIREALRSAENANQSKSVFLANMSHEIRTPMNGILGATELMLDQTIDEEQKQYIDIIHSSSHSLLNIINDILDLSKIESGNFELEQINFDLHQLCSDVYQLFSGMAKQKDIQVLYFYDADLPQFWIGDPNRIRQILNNLFSNALKFTHQGRIDIRVQGEQLDNHQYNLKLQIKDTGIGIAEKKVEQIFSAFQQADTSTSRKYGGTGLGLTISQYLANAMHGKITVESELGFGSAFSLNIPIKPGTIETVIKRSGQERNYRATVLLAEDNVVNAKIASKILEKLGIKALVVENGEIALHKTMTQTFDLVLMDVNMPIMDGITAAEKIRELSFPKNQIPILALTANAMMEDKERCLKAGMNGFISKPIKLARLIEELDKVLMGSD